MVGVSLLVVVALIGVAVLYWYFGTLFHRTTVHDLTGSSGQAENILLVGSTSRCALKVQHAEYGLCSQGINGVNSDIVMIVHLDPQTNQMSLLSIPRDTFIPNARVEGANKIDAALYEKPTQLVDAIQEDFGIPITHYVELNFETFASVVDALGGLKMYFPRPVFDAYSGLWIPHPGCYALNGYHALQVVRSRHLQIAPGGVTSGNSVTRTTWPQEAQSDIARIRRPHEFLRVLGHQLSAEGISNPSRDLSLATSVLPNLTVDQTFGESEMVSLASSYGTQNVSSVPQLTYPVVIDYQPYVYKGYGYGDVVFPIQRGGQQTLNAIFKVPNNTSTWNYQELPAPNAFKTSVVNGTGISGQAGTIAKGLQSFGFAISGVGDLTPVGPVAETVVWYGGPRPGSANWSPTSLNYAEQVLRHIQGPAVLGYNPAMLTDGAQVTVQTGTDLTLAPASTSTTPATTATTVHHTTTTAAGTTATTVPDVPGVATDNRFSAPTATAQPLQSWDPRSCNAAGTGPGTI